MPPGAHSTSPTRPSRRYCRRLRGGGVQPGHPHRSAHHDRRQHVARNTRRRGCFKEVCAAVTLTNTTVSGNRAAADGGGIDSVSIFCGSAGTTISLLQRDARREYGDDDGDGVGDGGGLFGQVNPVTTLRTFLPSRRTSTGVAKAPDCGGSSISRGLQPDRDVDLLLRGGHHRRSPRHLRAPRPPRRQRRTDADARAPRRQPRIERQSGHPRDYGDGVRGADQRGLSRPEPSPARTRDIGAGQMTGVRRRAPGGARGRGGRRRHAWPAGVRPRARWRGSFRVGPYEGPGPPATRS